jgi:signal transduction histidine kinase
VKLATRLGLLFLLLTSIPLTVIGILSYNNAHQALLDATLARLASTSALKRAEFTRWVGRNENSLELLAQRPLVVLAAIDLVDNEPGTAAYRTAHDSLIRDHMEPLLRQESGLLNVTLLHPTTGEILASTDADLEGGSRASEPFFLEGRIRTLTYPPLYVPADDEVVMHVVTPVYDGEGDLVAVLAAHANLAEIAEVISQGWERTETEETYLVNQNNFFVTESRFKPDSPFERTADTEGVADCLAGNDGTGFYLDYRDVPVVGAYEWIEEQNLCIMTEQDQAEALAPIVGFRRTAQLIGLGGSLFIALLGMLFARSLTGPLRSLVQGAEEIGRGNLDVRVGTRAKDEIGQLSRAFDQMVMDLKRTTVSRNELSKEVAERKRAEARLEEQAAALARSNEDLQQFAYVASHDLQEPLRMVTGYLQLIERRYRGKLDEDADEFITYAVDGATRMKRLINDLLAYSRVETRGQPFEPVALEDALSRVLHDLSLRIRESRAIVTRDPLPAVQADPSQVGQLLQNLIGNALKFSGDEPPRVHLSAERDGAMWAIAVRDHGIGFDPKYADRVFAIFERLHGRDVPGTGIGLAVCKRIVERHGGHIRVRSMPGEGATFIFTLPAVEAKPESGIPPVGSEEPTLPPAGAG